MLGVTIDINGVPIQRVMAVRVRGKAHEMCEYEIYCDGDVPLGRLKHHYDAGATVLAKKMLDYVIDRGHLKATGAGGE